MLQCPVAEQSLSATQSGISSIQGIPDELIECIFDFLPAASLAVVSAVSKRMRRLSSRNSSWRRHCHEWRYWSSHHKVRQRLREPANETDWRALYSLRKRRDLEIQSDFERVLSQQRGRIHHIENITKYGYDAKDIMLGFLEYSDSEQDVLARKYWANEVLGSIEREGAIEIWERVCDEHTVALEHVLGSLDLWVFQQPAYDLEDISARLDTLAESFLVQHKDDAQNLSSWSTRRKAVELGIFLNELGILRHSSLGESHRSLRNSMIGLVLFTTDHNALPAISAAIYCCIAHRIGLNAHLTNFPLHVYIVVPAQEGTNQDGQSSSDLVESLFIEPWTGNEVSCQRLKTQLTRLGRPASSFDDYLRPASNLEVMNRLSRTILTSIQEFGLTFETIPRVSSTYPTRILGVSASEPMESHLMESPVEINPFRANYCVCWLQMVMRLPSDSIRAMEGSQESIQLVNLLIQQIGSYHHDISLIEKYILPRFSRHSMEYQHLSITVSTRLRNEDDASRPVKRRPSSTTGIRGPHNDFADTVKYRIGDVFRHKRYNYNAIVIGWDPACMAVQSWIDRMGVESLPKGRDQSFYNVFVEDQSTRYVAEENIDRLGELSELGPEVPGPSLMREAGRWFKRFDPQKYRFISNMADEYPAD